MNGLSEEKGPLQTLERSTQHYQLLMASSNTKKNVTVALAKNVQVETNVSVKLTSLHEFIPACTKKLNA